MFQPSPFFTEQLTAFEVWLDHGSEHKKPPEQLPIVLQVWHFSCPYFWGHYLVILPLSWCYNFLGCKLYDFFFLKKIPRWFWFSLVLGGYVLSHLLLWWKFDLVNLFVSIIVCNYSIVILRVVLENCFTGGNSGSNYAKRPGKLG